MAKIKDAQPIWAGNLIRWDRLGYRYYIGNICYLWLTKPTSCGRIITIGGFTMEIYMKISNEERLELLNTVCYAYMGISNINKEIINSVSFTPLERIKIKLRIKVKKLEEYKKTVSNNFNSLAILIIFWAELKAKFSIWIIVSFLRHWRNVLRTSLFTSMYVLRRTVRFY